MPNFISVITPLGYTVHTTKTYWQYLIDIKHPCMKDKEEIIKQALENPEKICRSLTDGNVYLYYRRAERLYCAVVKQNDTRKEGFLITAYPTDKIKEGELIWTK